MTLDVRVRQITYRTEDILSYELVSLNGSELPAFTAGAHIDLHLANGMTRAYSLHNPPDDNRRYCITVQREKAGRGGSHFVHEQIKVGQALRISPPRNDFPLVEEAEHTIFVAGGIGVTPIIAMASRLYSLGKKFSVHYCGRTMDRLALLDELRVFASPEHIHLHIDGGNPADGLDVTQLLNSPRPGVQVYCCGPTPLLDAVRKATSHWPKGTVHFESFAPPPIAASLEGAKTSGGCEFEVELASSGTVIPVPHDKSILGALRDHGIEVESSCEAGTCGACKTRYLSGEPDHRDYVLADDEQGEFVMLCVSRCKSSRLVLDR